MGKLTNFAVISTVIGSLIIGGMLGRFIAKRESYIPFERSVKIHHATLIGFNVGLYYDNPDMVFEFNDTIANWPWYGYTDGRDPELVEWMDASLKEGMKWGLNQAVVMQGRDTLFWRDPFSKIVQEVVAREVLFLLKRDFNPNIPIPTILCAEEVTNEYNDSVWGYELGNLRSNIFDYRNNAILITKDAKVHNLAHELVHWVQWYYNANPEDWDNMAKYAYDHLEWEAVHIQNHFRPPRED